MIEDDFDMRSSDTFAAQQQQQQQQQQRGSSTRFTFTRLSSALFQTEQPDERNQLTETEVKGDFSPFPLKFLKKPIGTVSGVILVLEKSIFLNFIIDDSLVC